MRISEIFTNFKFGKGLSKTILGALAVGITMIIKNPESMQAIVPENILTMTIGGLILEALDYILNLINKAKGK